MGESRIRRAALAVFALCLAVYGATLYRTVPGGDAGELVVVAHNLAVAHPPGYPLWTMLAWLFSLVPAGSLAWRVAWLSAVCNAGAAAAVFWCAASYVASLAGPAALQGRASNAAPLAGGLVAASFFAFSPTVWLYAVGAEVFPLHCFFIALLFALALEWERSHDLRIAWAIAFATGLGLANHLTLVFYALPVAGWLLWTGRRELLTVAGLGTLVFAGVLGLAPYGYLLVAGSTDNPYSWGDPSTMSGFLDHLLRRDYGTFQLLPAGHAASSSYAEKCLAYAGHFSAASLGLGLVLAAVAVGFARGPFVMLVAGCAVFYVAVFHALANVAVGDPLLRAVLARFWMQADVALCILAGIGFGSACSRLGRRAAVVAWSAAALLVVLRLGMSGGERLGRGDGIVEGYGRAILEPLPQGTLLLTRGDLITNVVRYLQDSEGLREDVVVLDQELLTRPWYVRRMAAAHPDVRFPGKLYHPAQAEGFSMRDLLDANRDRESIAIYPEWKSGDASLEGRWRAWPEGLASRVLPAATPINPSKWALESAGALASLEARGWPPLDRYQPGSWERIVLEDLWQARHRRAVVLLNEAIAAGNDAGLLTIARGELEAAGRMHPDPPAAFFKNLGIVYSRLGPTQPWLKGEERKAWTRYLGKADERDPDRPAVEAVVRQLESAKSPPAAERR